MRHASPGFASGARCLGGAGAAAAAAPAACRPHRTFGRHPIRPQNSICYTRDMESLASVAERCDAAVEAARAELVAAVRHAHAQGMTQADIAHHIGRSQPEVNRLLRFHGSSPRARALREQSARVRAAIKDAGGTRVRVFGSTAEGTDGPDSDVDLLFDMRKPMSLMQLSTLERELTQLIGARVDLVPESSIRPDLREHILEQAVPL